MKRKTTQRSDFDTRLDRVERDCHRVFRMLGRSVPTPGSLAAAVSGNPSRLPADQKRELDRKMGLLASDSRTRVTHSGARLVLGGFSSVADKPIAASSATAPRLDAIWRERTAGRVPATEPQPAAQPQHAAHAMRQLMGITDNYAQPTQAKSTDRRILESEHRLVLGAPEHRR